MSIIIQLSIYLYSIIADETSIDNNLQLSKKVSDLEAENRNLVRRIEASRKIIARLKLERRFLLEKWQQERIESGQQPLPSDSVHNFLSSTSQSQYTISRDTTGDSERSGHASPPSVVAYMTNRPLSNTTSVVVPTSLPLQTSTAKRKPTPIISAVNINSTAIANNSTSPNLPNASLGNKPRSIPTTPTNTTQPDINSNQQSTIQPSLQNIPGTSKTILSPTLSNNEMQAFTEYSSREMPRLAAEFPIMDSKELESVLISRFKRHVSESDNNASTTASIPE